VHVLDKVGQVIDCNAIVTDVRSDNVRGQREQGVFGRFIIGHVEFPSESKDLYSQGD
jgi:hypothetical protein